MSGNFHTSGYVTESDLKTFTLEHNDKLNSKIKSTLRKIHRLKRENLVLSARRKSYYKEVKAWFGQYGNTGNDHALLWLGKINKTSEKIGKNGTKIQRLRTKIAQLKKSLIPVVDKGFNF